MAPANKMDKKTLLDGGSWLFNICTSVGIIMTNKLLMASMALHLNWFFIINIVLNLSATTLTGMHFLFTTLMTIILKRMGYVQPSHLPLLDLVKFVFVADISVVGMNVSLMWNSVGFYQIAKLSMIPVSCFFEIALDRVRYSRDTKLSIGVVLLGVAICTVTDVSLHTKGFIAALLAVWSSCLQQYLLILLSCVIAIGTNLSQFICIGRFTAVSFQVLGHMKTVLVLVLGQFLFGKELTLKVILGMIIAMVGMIWYEKASSKPGGRDKRNYSISSDRSHKYDEIIESSDLDDKV